MHQPNARPLTLYFFKNCVYIPISQTWRLLNNLLSTQNQWAKGSGFKPRSLLLPSQGLFHFSSLPLYLKCTGPQQSWLLPELCSCFSKPAKHITPRCSACQLVPACQNASGIAMTEKKHEPMACSIPSRYICPRSCNSSDTEHTHWLVMFRANDNFVDAIVDQGQG